MGIEGTYAYMAPFPKDPYPYTYPPGYGDVDMSFLVETPSLSDILEQRIRQLEDRVVTLEKAVLEKAAPAPANPTKEADFRRECEEFLKRWASHG